MSIRKLGSLTLATWLVLATTSIAQSNNPYVFDTSGEPLESDEEYYIRPSITENGGGFTLINRNGSCPLYVGLENSELAVKLSPFVNEDEEDVRLNRDLRVAFDASSTCVQSTEWRLSENERRNGRRVIITGRDEGRGQYGNYFRIVETETSRMYNIQWCPMNVCPTCRFVCGTVGILRENGRILLALDGTELPLVFQKKED